MPLLKRKPVPLVPLPSLAAVLQPFPNPPRNNPPLPNPPRNSPPPDLAGHIPQDCTNDQDQMHALLRVFNGHFPPPQLVLPARRKQPKPSTDTDPPPEHTEIPAVAWKIHDRDTFYLPETGEIFTDYESFSHRRAFYAQPLFQCEVTGKQAQTYLGALHLERHQTLSLHGRFARGLKRAVLGAVQFAIEGKLDVLAEKVFDRLKSRFFLDERVFVDIQGDKYLALVTSITPPPSSTMNHLTLPHDAEIDYHPAATDLRVSLAEADLADDPMAYTYSVRLVRNADVDPADHADLDLVVEPGQISRDRLMFSRALLKKFIRDSVDRDPAVYSPWIVKPMFARSYNIRQDMSDAEKEWVRAYREKMMGRRKREREERLGMSGDADAEDADELEHAEHRPRTKKEKREDEKKVKEEEKVRKREEEERKKEEEEEERKKRKGIRFPNEDLLVDQDNDRVRPALDRQMPFGDQFEMFLMTWSFLNVFGKPLRLSPFTIDDLAQSLYHPTAPTPPLLAAIHTALLDALVAHLAIPGSAPPKPLAATGRVADDDREYWEGKGGITTELLGPVCDALGHEWDDAATEGVRGIGWETALVRCLWRYATLESLPAYLDNILFLTHEPKPAPTRPTWSTAPTSASGPAPGALVPASRIGARYPALHHAHKLHIIAWLIELVGQTEVVRAYMDESVGGLTEVRKMQVDTKREWRKVLAEREALEPKDTESQPGEVGAGAEDDELEEDGHEEIDLDPSSPCLSPSSHSSPEHDLEPELEPDVEADAEPEPDHVHTTASRRRAMAEAAKSRALSLALSKEKAQKEREQARVRKAEGKLLTAEKKRLDDEEVGLRRRLRELDYEFRGYSSTLRVRPMGGDRFGNRVWWMDAHGSAGMLSASGPGAGGVGAGAGAAGAGTAPVSVPVYTAGFGPGDLEEKINPGTGRLYVQAADRAETRYVTDAANAVYEAHGVDEVVTEEAVEVRRRREEGGGGGGGGGGEWGCWDQVEQVQELVAWLNPKGVREKELLKALTFWRPELEAGMRKRRVLAGLDQAVEEEAVQAVAARRRPTRRTAGDDGVGAGVGVGVGNGVGNGNGVGYMGWRNRRA